MCGRLTRKENMQHLPERYCQLKLDLVDWTCDTHGVIPDKSMDYVHTNCLFRVGFSLS